MSLNNEQEVIWNILLDKPDFEELDNIVETTIDYCDYETYSAALDVVLLANHWKRSEYLKLKARKDIEDNL